MLAHRLTIAAVFASWAMVVSPARAQGLPAPITSRLATTNVSEGVTTVGHELAGAECETVCDDLPCDPCDDFGCSTGGLFGDRPDWLDDSGLSVRGWLDQGFTWNTSSPQNRFNGPQPIGGRRRYFTDRSNEYQLNQLYLIVERRADRDADDWGIGGRLDLLYGTDYFFTTALGLETKRDGTQRWNGDSGPRGAATYGLAMPQLYAELYAPLAEGVSFKFGHFYSPLGYEQVAAPENFFYSRSYSMQYGRPLTHTGMLAEIRATDEVTLTAGLTRGWDNWEDLNNDLAVIGGIAWTDPDDVFRVAYAFHNGNEGAGVGNNRFVHTLLASVQLTDRMQYVFEHGFGNQDNGSVDESFALVSAQWYSFAHYLFYEVTCDFSVGARFELFRDEDNSRVIQLPFDNTVRGRDYYQFTIGGNWRPHEAVVIRPEIRFDWSNVESPLFNLSGPYNDLGSDSQTTIGTDVIITF